MPAPLRSLLVFGVAVAAACGATPGSAPPPSASGSAPDAATALSTEAAAATAPPTSAGDAGVPAPTTTAPATSASQTDGESTGSNQPAPPTTTEPAPTAPETSVREPIVMRIRLDRRVNDDATAGFESLVQAVLDDERGWRRADFEFAFSPTEYDYTVVLAEGAEVDELCLPYDTFGRFSCQIGPVVALNADRWRTAVESWPTSLDDYRTMLVNHEVGHLLGQHHPAVRCPGDGLPAPVMAQQSSGVAPCTANPWPLDWEIVCAKQRVEPLAPPFERDIELTCGPDGPIER